MSSSGTFVLHLRHVPCKVLEADLMDAMRAAGLDSPRYNVYFPKRPGRHGVMNNFGYGFVTCREQEDADVFTRLFQGFQFANIQSDKRMLVEPTREARPMGPRRVQRGTLQGASDEPETCFDPMRPPGSQEDSLHSAYGHSNFSARSQSANVGVEGYSPVYELYSMGPSCQHADAQRSACGYSSTLPGTFVPAETYLPPAYAFGSSSCAYSSGGSVESSTSAAEMAGLRKQAIASPEGWELPPTRLMASAQEFYYQ
eukprot:TRINITY_DN6262_c1_g2_i1.p1 TRINITY_DN6262_c1_g2~~TRINITY_DN6262_c1_g2_i1.p1  ORF type:complete len:256 (+),score=31.91 TRINITY_DN6262_c1_g2_i1:39-806(+)